MEKGDWRYRNIMRGWGSKGNLGPSDLVLNTGIVTERSFILLQKNYRMNVDFIVRIARKFI